MAIDTFILECEQLKFYKINNTIREVISELCPICALVDYKWRKCTEADNCYASTLAVVYLGMTAKEAEIIIDAADNRLNTIERRVMNKRLLSLCLPTKRNSEI